MFILADQRTGSPDDVAASFRQYNEYLTGTDGDSLLWRIGWRRPTGILIRLTTAARTLGGSRSW